MTRDTLYKLLWHTGPAKLNLDEICRYLSYEQTHVQSIKELSAEEPDLHVYLEDLENVHRIADECLQKLGPLTEVMDRIHEHVKKTARELEGKDVRIVYEIEYTADKNGRVIEHL